MKKIWNNKLEKSNVWMNIICILFIILYTSGTTGFAQQPIIVFSENFDNASSSEPWPYHSQGWIHSGVTLASEPNHGKVLKMNYPEGTVGSESGMGNYRIPLDSSYRELYITWEYFIPSDFNFGYDDGGGGGKFFASFAGGPGTTIPNTDYTDNDGWAGMLLFKEGFTTEYNYFKSTSYSPEGWPSVSKTSNLILGEWHRIGIRMKVNRGSVSDGVFEVFEDDVLSFQRKNIKIVNAVHPDYLIEQIYLNNFWGGSGDKYRCPVNQYMMFDNLQAFYYPAGSPDYREGPSEQGRIITVPVATSYHPLPPNIFTETTYTDASGTIKSHCGFEIMAQNLGNFETSTIEIDGATSITMNVTRFSYNSGTNMEEKYQILKLYEGTGNNKILKKTFKRGENTQPGSVTINGNSATIEWQAGSGEDTGFTLEYTSDGNGSGQNFECQDFIAHDASFLYENYETPPVPTNLSVNRTTTDYIEIKWNGETDKLTGYEVYRINPYGFVDEMIELSSSQTTYIDQNIKASITYKYIVRAINIITYSAFSDTLEAKSMDEKPNTPSSLKVKSTTSTSITLGWIDLSPSETGFELVRMIDGIEDTTIMVGANPVTYSQVQYADQGLVPNTTYQYKVRAVNDVGSSSYTSIVSGKTDIGTGFKVTETDHLKIYPNPNKGRFTIELQTESPSMISVLDALGKKIIEAENDDRKTLTIDLGDVSVGLYLLKITTSKNNILTKKIIINK